MLTSTNYPSAFVCNMQRISYSEVICTCEKISNFINQIGYNVSNISDYPYIVAAINNYFNIPAAQYITVTQLSTILSDCAAGSISGMTDFQNNNIPEVLLCAVPTGTDPTQIEEAEELSDCMQNNLNIATSYAVQVFNSLTLHDAETNFRAEYTNYCLGQAKSSQEKFTMDYTLDEFKFTLYYYDQAGNFS